MAKITGILRARARRVMSFCTRGTRSSGISRAEIAARDHDRVGAAQNLVEMFDRLRPFELGDQRDVARLGVRHDLRGPGERRRRSARS